MNKLFGFGLLALAAYTIWKLFFQRERDRLDQHLDEQRDLQQLGRITTRGTIYAKSQAPFTRVEPTGAEGAVYADGYGGAPEEDPLAKYYIVNGPFGPILLPTGAEN
jgi:hypothetical protein